jgi:hypothetical protein
MGEHQEAPKGKIVLNIGGGPPPGYLWSVVVLDAARDEAMRFLNDEQYDHLALQVCEMARDANPTQCQFLDIKSISNFYELRDTGGVLGKINARVFFAILHDRRLILILGTMNKNNNDQTATYKVELMNVRLRRYLQA